MKKTIWLSALLLCISLVANAQDKIVVTEIMGTFSKGQHTGLEVLIPDGDKKSVEKSWIKLMKTYKGRVPLSPKATEIVADNAVIPAVSENPVDVYAITQTDEKGIKLMVFIDLGAGFISSHQYALAYTAFEAFLRQFALEEIKRTVDAQASNEEQLLIELEKSLTALQKDKEAYLAEIEKCKAIIAQREQDIITNDINQATKAQQIELQKSILSTVKEKRTLLGN